METASAYVYTENLVKLLKFLDRHLKKETEFRGEIIAYPLWILRKKKMKMEGP